MAAARDRPELGGSAGPTARPARHGRLGGRTIDGDVASRRRRARRRPTRSHSRRTWPTWRRTPPRPGTAPSTCPDPGRSSRRLNRIVSSAVPWISRTATGLVGAQSAGFTKVAPARLAIAAIVSAWAHDSAYDMNPPFEWPSTSIRFGSTANDASISADDAGEVGRVVDALAVEVTARVGRVPEPVPVVARTSRRGGRTGSRAPRRARRHGSRASCSWPEEP